MQVLSVIRTVIRVNSSTSDPTSIACLEQDPPKLNYFPYKSKIIVIVKLYVCLNLPDANKCGRNRKYGITNRATFFELRQTMNCFN